MNTTESIRGIDPQVMADLADVIKHFLEGTTPAPNLAFRVSERSRMIQEKMRERLDTDLAVDLLREAREDA